MLLVQDIDSHSMLVRFYYQHRIFMGFCCVSVEVLYLLVSALSTCEGLPAYSIPGLPNPPFGSSADLLGR